MFGGFAGVPEFGGVAALGGAADGGGAAEGAVGGGPSVPQSQGPYALPSGKQLCPPSHRPGPMQAWVEPGTQAR